MTAPAHLNLIARADPNHDLKKICRASLLVLKHSKPDSDGLDRVLLFADGPGSAVQDGEIVTHLMDAKAAKSIIKAFEAQGVDMVIDYEHQTLGGEFSSPDGTAPAAGMVKSFEYVEGEGLYGLVKWTDRAKKLIDSGEYRYHSPVYLVDEDSNRIVKVHSFALTNKPATIEIEPLAAKERLVANKLALIRRIIAQAGGTAVEPLALILAALDITEQFASPEAALQAVLNEIRTLKGEGESAPGEAPPEDVAEAAKQLLDADENQKTVAAIAKQLGVKDSGELVAAVVAIAKKAKATKTVAASETAALKDQLTTSTERVKALEEKDQARELEAFLDGGRQSGRIVKALEDAWVALWKSDPEVAAEKLKAAPVIVATDGKKHKRPEDRSDMTGDDAVDHPENWDDKRAPVHAKVIAKMKEKGKDCTYGEAYTLVTGNQI